MLPVDTALSSSASLPSRFRLGEWIVDSALCELQRDNERIPLPGLSLSLLLALARRAGDLADSDSILSEVSPHDMVNDATLQQCIKLLRHALDDNRGTPRYIATMGERGYRLSATLQSILQLSVAPSFPRRRESSVSAEYNRQQFAQNWIPDRRTAAFAGMTGRRSEYFG